MAIEVLKQEFQDHMNFMCIIGRKLFIRPFTKKSKLQMICYYFISFLVFFTTFQLFFSLCLTGFKDWLEMVNIAPNIGACIMSTVKFSTIHNNQDFYEMVYKHYHDNLFELIDESTEDIIIFTKFKHISRMLYRFIVTFAISLTFVVDSFPFLLMTYERKVLGRDSPYLYPFDAWYPFDKVKWYSVAYIWESLMTAIVIVLYAFPNLVHMSYMAFICMELNLLGNWLQRLINNIDVVNITHNKNLNKTHKRIKKDLKFIIKRYERLDKISSGLNKVMGNLNLLSYVTAAVFICLTAFSCTVTDDLFKFLRYFSFCLSLLVEMFTQCVIGQVLLDHSAALTERIYSSQWIYADAETKKILLMLVVRTQKPFKLSAKGFVDINLNTYSQICISSYQLFNLLRTLYE